MNVVFKSHVFINLFVPFGAFLWLLHSDHTGIADPSMRPDGDQPRTHGHRIR
jgi:hypothetical protein